MSEIIHSKLTAKRPWMFRSRPRLFGALFLVVAIPTAILTLLTALFVSGELREQAVKQNTVTARLVAKQIDEQFFGLRRYVESFATRPSLINPLQANNAKAVQQQLVDLIEQNRKLSRAVITGTNGVLRFNYPNERPVIGKGFPHHDWFQDISRSSRSYVSAVYKRTPLGQAAVVMIVARIDGEGTRPIGYLGAQYAVADLMEWLLGMQPSRWDRTAVFDQNGNHVLRIKAASHLNISRHPGVRKILQKPEGTLRIENLNGFDHSIVSHVPISKLGWTVISYQPVEAIFAPVKRLIGTILIFFLAALASLGLLGWLWHRVLFAYAEDLRRSNKELESFCYSIAHNLRAPLRAMQGFSTLMDEEFTDKLDNKGKHYAQRIATSAKQMDRLISDLLEYGSIAHANLDFAKIDLTQAVTNALQKIAHQIQQANAQVSLRNPLGSVSSDQNLLQHALAHLLSNALKYVAPNVAPKIEIWSEDKKDTVRLWIKDNGIGIAPKYHQKIFEVFQQLHASDAYHGTGIGLAIVNKAAERIGGAVGVESEPGKGSAFWIQLPKQ